MSFNVIPFFAWNKLSVGCSGNLLADMSGLQAYYKMDGDATDSSGNGYNGTATSIIYDSTDKIFNQSASFSAASSSKILTSTCPNITDAYTISVWVRFLTKAGNKTILNLGTDPNFTSLVINGSNVIIGKHTTDWTSTTTLTSGIWYHLVLRKEAGSSSNNMTLWVDGSSVYSFTRSPKTMSGKISIGCYNTGSDFFNGQIDDLNIWNRALSSDEITTLAAGTCPLSTDSL